MGQGVKAAEEKLCRKQTAAHAQHEGLSMAPDAAAALEELLHMVAGQAPTDDLRQRLAKVQAANVTAAHASVRTPPGAAAAGHHHPEVLQRAAANRDSAWDCLARAKRLGLGQQMLPQDLVVSIVSPNLLHNNINNNVWAPACGACARLSQAMQVLLTRQVHNVTCLSQECSMRCSGAIFSGVPTACRSVCWSSARSWTLWWWACRPVAH